MAAETIETGLTVMQICDSEKYVEGLFSFDYTVA